MGIITRENNGMHQDYLRIIYKGNDELLVPLSQFKLIRRYVAKEGVGIKLNRLGSKDWEKTRRKVSEKVEELAARLVELYALRSENIGYAFSKDTPMQAEFEDQFEYELTADQQQAVDEIKHDMESPRPMDRLLCGDVGFGKTEVAVRAAFKAVADNKQVAFLCPTTILSMQHYQTFLQRFSGLSGTYRSAEPFYCEIQTKRDHSGHERGHSGYCHWNASSVVERYEMERSRLPCH